MHVLRQPIRRFVSGALHLGILLATTSLALSHDGIHEKIDALTLQIESHPGRADLHLLRADLYRRHRDWGRALADVEWARRADPTLERVHFQLGAVLRDQGRLDAAAQAMDRYLRACPRDPLALKAGGELATLRSRHAAAVSFYNRLIAACANPTPDAYVARARAQLAVGPRQQACALVGIEEGLIRCARSTPLLLMALELDRGLGRTDSALRRVALLASLATRQESWQALRGDVLREASRNGGARIAYRSCLSSIEALKKRHRETRAVQDLLQRVHEALEELDEEARR